MSAKNIEAVITDIGGVLIKTDEAIIACIQRVVRDKGIPDGSVQTIYNVLGISLRDYILAYLPEGFKHRINECYTDFKKIYPSEVMHLLRPFPEVDETLVYLKEQRFRLGVFSCMTRKEVTANLSLLKFKAFDNIFSLEDYGDNHRRPDPTGLLMLIERIGSKPEHVIYVGDTDSDVMMARNVGIISVGVRSGAQPEDRLRRADPDHLLDSFKDIPKQVLTKNKNRF